MNQNFEARLQYYCTCGLCLEYVGDKTLTGARLWHPLSYCSESNNVYRIPSVDLIREPEPEKWQPQRKSTKPSFCTKTGTSK